MENHFQVDVRRQDHATVLVVSGELDLATSPALADAVDQAQRSDSELLIVDLREVAFMDSSGLSVVVNAHRRAQESGRRFALVRGTPQVQQLLELTSVTDLLTIIESPDELLNSGDQAGPSS